MEGDSRSSPAPSPRPLRVALVSMPFATTRRPSIQLGLLQAILVRRGIAARTHYLNLQFGARIGWETYEALCTEIPLLGEWIFAGAAFRERAVDPDVFLNGSAQDLGPFTDVPDVLRRIRDGEAPAFIDDCMEAVPWASYDVVGFSSLFDQNTAALALARSVKEKHPRVITVFGGANFEDEMGLEYVRALPWIDYAVIGEGDEAFPQLLDRLAAGEEALGVPGVAYRRDGAVSFAGPAPLLRDLDALPTPSYEDFFATAAELDFPFLVDRSPFRLSYESARGCWWGAKHHCTFCGLNGLGMAYRSKSPARVLDEIHELAERYPCRDFAAVDNILDMRYVSEVFGVLARQRNGLRFFYEVKANLTREQLQELARGGMHRIQPGIESLDTHVLKLMRKGVTAIQNVRFLKWASSYGMEVTWNIIVGFPGERPEDYARQLDTLRLIPHLPPPLGGGRIRLDRFSPYFNEPAAWGIVDVRPLRGYSGIYPSELHLERLAYYFDYQAPDTLPEEAHAALYEHLDWWKQAWESSPRPELSYARESERLTITDHRRSGAPRVHVLEGAAAQAYEYCSPTYHNTRQVTAWLHDRGFCEDHGAVQRIMDSLSEAGLAFEEDGLYLSLALPSDPWPEPAGHERGHAAQTQEQP